MSSFCFEYQMPLWPDGPTVEVEGECVARLQPDDTDEWIVDAIMIDGHDFHENLNPELHTAMSDYIHETYEDEGYEAAVEADSNARIEAQERRGELV